MKVLILRNIDNGRVAYRYGVLLFAKQLRDSALPKVVLVNRFMKGISFAFRRGTIAQATTHQAPRP